MVFASLRLCRRTMTVLWFLITLPLASVALVWFGVVRRRRKQVPTVRLVYSRPVTREEVEAKLEELSHKAAEMIVEALTDEGRIEK